MASPVTTGLAGPAAESSTAKKDVAQVNADLYTSTSFWLKKHGKGVKPKLTDDQKEQLKECFELMDQDGSGAIDAEELGAAFRLLGIRMKRAELAALLAEVDHDGSGEVEYPEFLEIMTVTLQRLAEEEDSEKNEGQVPFALMATAYRRKRLMEGIINGDKEVQAQIQQISDKANLEALQATKAAEVESQRAKAAGEYSGATAAHGSGTGTNNGGVQQARPRSSSARPIRRPAQSEMSKALLEALGPEERRLVNSLAAKAIPIASRASPPPLPVANSRAYGHFSNSPSHRQLIDTPQLLDLRFMHQSTIRLPPGAGPPTRTMSGGVAGLGPGPGPGLGHGGGGGGGGGGASGSGYGGHRESSLSGVGMSPLGQMRRASMSARAGTPPGMLSPGRGGRLEEALPALRFDGGGMTFPVSKQPVGTRLGTHPGAIERGPRGS